MARKSRKHLNNANANTAPPIRTYTAGAYLRISAEDETSITNQRFIIEELVELKSDIQLHKFYIDDGVSSFSGTRPAFDSLIKDLSDGIIDCVITKDLSRFGRDYIETGDYIFRTFPACGIRVISILDRYDSLENTNGPDTAVILSTIFNSSYSYDLSRKVKSTIQTKQIKGTYIPAQLPYGYKKEIVLEKTLFAIDDYAAKIVQKIFDWSISGDSSYAIASRLNSMDIFSPSAYKAEQQKIQLDVPPIWTSQAVSGILKNRTYTGCLVMGKTKNINGKLKRPQKVPENEWIFCENHHEPIISKEQFDEVQKKLANKRSRHTTLSKSNPSFIGEKLFCGNCGRKMRRRVWHGKTYYMCPRNLESKGGCPTRSKSEENLRDEIWESIQLEIEKAKSYRDKQLQYENSLSYKIRKNQQDQLLEDLMCKKERLASKKQELYENVHGKASYTLNDYLLFSSWASEQIYALAIRIKEIEDVQAEYKHRFSSEAKWAMVLLSFEEEVQLKKTIFDFLIEEVYTSSKYASVRLIFSKVISVAKSPRL